MRARGTGREKETDRQRNIYRHNDRNTHAYNRKKANYITYNIWCTCIYIAYILGRLYIYIYNFYLAMKDRTYKHLYMYSYLYKLCLQTSHTYASTHNSSAIYKHYIQNNTIMRHICVLYCPSSEVQTRPDIALNNYKWRTCSRAINRNCLGWDSNPCSPRCRSIALTNPPPCVYWQFTMIW